MKKNLMSIIILALLVVNIVLTSIMMFSVTGVSKRTSTLIGDIASVLNLELTVPSEEGVEEVVAVPLEDVASHTIPDKMTIPLKTGEDGKPHFVQVSVSFSMNKKDKAYKTYGETMSERDPILKDIVSSVFRQYTVGEVTDQVENIKKEILKQVQARFESEFIFDVAFGEMTPS